MNHKLVNISESINVVLANKVRERISNGQPVLQLQTGDPDFSTASEISEALNSAVLANNTHYCNSSGLNDFKHTISEKLRQNNKYTLNHLNQITITHGAVQAVHLALASILNPGDEVILIAPYWLAYQTNVELNGAITRILITSAENNFEPDTEQLNSLINKKTKAVIINSPNNPTGAVYQKNTLVSIAKLCEQHNLYIISDEVYEALTYDKKHYSIQSLYPEYDKIISIYSFSKTYAMTGWRLGYMVTSPTLAEQINKLIQFQSTCINPAIQSAGQFALSSPLIATTVEQNRKHYQARRDLVLSLSKNSWLEDNLTMPSGAFYFWLNISQFKMNAMRFCQLMLEEHNLSLTPGHAFSEHFNNYVRFTFAISQSDLTQAITILKSLE